MSVVELEQKIDKLEELRRLRLAADTGRPVWSPLPIQEEPEPGWYMWLLMGGRGSGKTDGCAVYFDRWMRQHPGHRGAIVAPTLGDAVESCVNGPSGLKAYNPTVRLSVDPGGTHVRWPNGSEAKLFGCHTREDVERLRAGGNRHIAWFEEWAAWRYLQEATEQVEFGLRLGEHPHIVASTTPKPRLALVVKEMQKRGGFVQTHGTMEQNPYLPAHVRAALKRKYAGTRIGRQELDGELIEEVEGALWTYRLLEQSRADAAPDLARVVVAVDPSGGDQDGNDEQGIVIAGLGVDGDGYVLADRSCKLSPGGWGKRTIRAWEMFDADEIVAEPNYGGEMVRSNVEMAAQAMGVFGVKIELIPASRGKVARAEPVAALYEQGRVHHVGVFEQLELQMTQWTPESGWSPDRMDALVWALTRLMVKPEKRRSWAPAGAS